jgi:hypothetical protein
MAFDILTQADDSTLHWRQPDRLTRLFVLAAEGDRTLGRLEVVEGDTPGIVAETAQGTWRFDNIGSWTPHLRAFVGEEMVATLEVTDKLFNSRATLVDASGQPIAQWVMTRFLAGTVEWQDSEGSTLITFRRGTDEGGTATWFRTQCRVDFTPAGFAHPDRDLLLTMGWHFMVQVGNPII